MSTCEYVFPVSSLVCILLYPLQTVRGNETRLVQLGTKRSAVKLSLADAVRCPFLCLDYYSENEMRRVFDVLAVVNGTFGLGYIFFSSASITPYNADIQSATVMVVLACVIVPFFVARSLEQLDFQISVPNIMPARTRQPQELSLDSPQTSYFDYLFNVDPADVDPAVDGSSSIANSWSAERRHSDD